MTRRAIRHQEHGRISPQLWNVGGVIEQLRSELQLLDRTIADLERMAQRIDLVLATPSAGRRNTSAFSSRTGKTLILVPRG